MSAGAWIANAWRNLTTFRGRTTNEAGVPVEVFVHDVDRGRGRMSGLTPAALWRTQPHLRTVVDFRARNVAQLGLKLYRRGVNANERVPTGEIAALLRRPNDFQTGTELIYDLMASRDLFDVAYWFIFEGDSGLQIMPFPADWVMPIHEGHRVTGWRVTPPGTNQAVIVPPEQVVPFRGWSPGGLLDSPHSKVDTLREILEAQAYSWRHRINLWLRGSKQGQTITRPVDAPAWDSTARNRFLRMFEAFTTGEKAGGVPILEDGMKVESHAFNSADEQWAESVKLSLETVAQVFQVNPTMVGVLDNANYSNVQAFNRQLFTNSLGPDIVAIEDRINEFVLPLLGADDDLFVKFNVEAKLRGSFEEQAAVLSTASGAPWMTRNEVRKLQDMPPIDGGDELVVPLNLGAPADATPQLEPGGSE